MNKNSEYKMATIKTTKEELETIGISYDINDSLAKVFDIDKFYGIGGFCSRIIVNIPEAVIQEQEFIVPTTWLKFIKE